MNSPKALFSHFAFAFLFLLLTSQANATHNMFCSGIDSDTDVTILFGAGPVLAPLEADIYFDGKAISTRDRENAEDATIVQFSADDEHLRMQLINDQADTLLATVRVLRHFNDDEEPVQIGLLQFGASTPVGITCEGP
ncbi:hypothetical protein [uncultured Roseibium sp.]|uniref:hypothetical protein n=1 Tax=uncultured Roseibium sp. TaxID=1936171 RepID=UPI002630E42E|nr:hypothetical protein [uncultured Roseibium sp.]